ncbi:MAG: preQ(1) synthase [Dehalococcoidia bacterium]
MTSVKDLQEKYENLDIKFRNSKENVINSNLIMCFDYEYTKSGAEVVIDTDEFTAVCPWTRLPDFGTLTVSYIPNKLCLELKSLKYYLLSYTGVEIVQEHAANKILEDLASACNPFKLSVKLDYKIRGGLHTTVKVELGDQ